MVFDPLLDLQNLPKERNLKEKIEEDQDYKNGTLDLKGAKEDLKKQIGYGPFIPKENGDNKEKIDLKNIPEEIQENKYFPVLKKLLDKGLIEEEKFSDIFDDIKDDGEIDFDKFDLGENELKIQEILKKIPKDEKKGQDDLGKESLNNKQEDENKENFYKDFPEIKKTVDNQDEKDENKLKMNVIYEKVGKNYIKIDSGNTDNNEKNENQNKEDKEKDYSLAIKTTANQEINKTKNLNKDSETYKKSIELVNGGETIEKQLEGLKNLYYYIHTNEGKFGTKNINNRDKNISEQKLTLEQELIKKEYYKINEQIKKEGEIPELIKQRDDIIKKAQLLEKNKEIPMVNGIIGGNEKDEISETQESGKNII